MKGVMNSWTKRMVFFAPGMVTMFLREYSRMEESVAP